MLGAVVGDICGSVWEGLPQKSTCFPLFLPRSRYTDDTVLTVAIASSILGGRSYADELRDFGRAYPSAGYGGGFMRWLRTDRPSPYGSYGNGSAMRVSPIGWAFESLDEVLREAKASAMPTHDHPEGIKGAQAVAAAVFLARKGAPKEEIKTYLEVEFGYDLSRRLDDIRKVYRFDASCQGSVPEAIIAFLESADFEGAIRNAISLGGDADTQAAISGSVAEAFYGPVPREIFVRSLSYLDLRLYGIVRAFVLQFNSQAATIPCLAGSEPPPRAPVGFSSEGQGAGEVEWLD